MSSHQRSPEVAFFKIGLGGENGQIPGQEKKNSWIIKTLTTIKAELGHANVSCKHFQTRELLGPNSLKVQNDAVY